MSETLREVFVYGVVRPINHQKSHISIKAFKQTLTNTQDSAREI